MTQQDVHSDAPAGAAALIAAARRVTVKVGSSLLIDPAGNGVRRSWLAGLGEDIAALRGQGKQVVVVSSGCSRGTPFCVTSTPPDVSRRRQSA